MCSHTHSYAHMLTFARVQGPSLTRTLVREASPPPQVLPDQLFSALRLVHRLHTTLSSHGAARCTRHGPRLSSRVTATYCCSCLRCSIWGWAGATPIFFASPALARVWNIVGAREVFGGANDEQDHRSSVREGTLCEPLELRPTEGRGPGLRQSVNGGA